MTDTQLSRRPLSPHISIYKPQITSILSIAHRISGVLLYLGFVCFVWLFVLRAYGYSLEVVTFFFQSWLGQLFLVGWGFTLYYHLLNGIRHLFWDIGKGYDLKTVTFSGYLVVVGAVLLSVASLCVVWCMGS